MGRATPNPVLLVVDVVLAPCPPSPHRHRPHRLPQVRESALRPRVRPDADAPSLRPFTRVQPSARAQLPPSRLLSFHRGRAHHRQPRHADAAYPPAPARRARRARTSRTRPSRRVHADRLHGAVNTAAVRPSDRRVCRSSLGLLRCPLSTQRLSLARLTGRLLQLHLSRLSSALSAAALAYLIET